MVLFFQVLPQELAPLEDRSTLRISSRAQEGATFGYMDAYMDDQIALARETVPEASTIITVTSPGFGASSAVNNGFMRIRLVPPEERDRSQMEIANDFEAALQGLQGARTFVTQMEDVMGRCLDDGVKVVSNAGGLDPGGCADAVAEVHHLCAGQRHRLQRRRT